MKTTVKAAPKYSEWSLFSVIPQPNGAVIVGLLKSGRLVSAKVDRSEAEEFNSLRMYQRGSRLGKLAHKSPAK